MSSLLGAWYRTGKVSVTQDSNAVIGVGTGWKTALLEVVAGDIFTVDSNTWYEVIAVDDDTHLFLDRDYEASDNSDTNYAIIRSTSGTVLTSVAGQVALQFNQKQLLLDEINRWLISVNDTENVTDSHGKKFALTTPKKMNFEHLQKISELEILMNQVISNTSFHIWKAYADDALGGGISLDSVGKKYIGFAMGRESSEVNIDNPNLFDWSLFKGADGVAVDGTSSYLHIAYADDANGTGFTQNSTGKTFIGIYSDGTIEDSSFYSDYSWTEIPKGKDGFNPTVEVNEDGTYTINGLNGSIVIRDGNTPTVTDNGDGTTTIDDGNGGIAIVSDGRTPVKGAGLDYNDGNNGDYVSFCFREVITGSDAPTVSGGSYDGETEITPIGYTDNPTYSNGNTTYIVKRRYHHDIETGNWVGGFWSTPAIFADKGGQGETGGDGEPGNRGTKHVYALNDGWSDSLADFTIGGGKIVWDVVTISHAVTGFSQTKRWDGLSWVVVGQVIDTDLLINGAIKARHLDIEEIFAQAITASGSITGATLVGGSFETNAGNTGRTKITGTRIEHFLTGDGLPAFVVGADDSSSSKAIVNIGRSGWDRPTLDVKSSFDKSGVLGANRFDNFGTAATGHFVNSNSGGGGNALFAGSYTNESAIKTYAYGANLALEAISTGGVAAKFTTPSSSAPFIVNSTTKVANLNANMVEGKTLSELSTYKSLSNIHGTVNMTTAQFVAALTAHGCFSNTHHWVGKATWSYAGHGNITDTGCGTIDLAGATIEVISGSSSYYMIRVTGAPAGTSAHKTWTYRNHGATYGPGWSRDYTTRDKPSLSELSGTAATVDVNTSGSTSFYNMVWHSGDTLYSSHVSEALQYRPSDGFLKLKHGYLGGNKISFDANGKMIARDTAKRSAGMYGLYDPYKISHVWSMGAAYAVHAGGANFGTLYGMAYKHTNNATGGTMAGGHQLVVCQNGVPGVALGMGGTIWVKGNLLAASDKRLKSNIRVIDNALDKIDKVGGYTFDRVDKSVPRQAGVIAQEMKEILPEVVSGDDKGFYSVSYGNICALLIQGIKELRAEVETLKMVA